MPDNTDPIDRTTTNPCNNNIETSECLFKAVQPVPPNPTSQDVLTTDRFAEVAKHVLQKIDKNNAGYVTKEQLANAIEDPSFKGEQTQALVAMYENFDKLSHLRAKGWFGGHSITTGDLDKFNDLQIVQESLAVANAHFFTTAISTLGRTCNGSYKDGSGSVSKEEIAAVLKDPKVSSADRQMLGLLRSHFSEITKTKSMSYIDLSLYAAKLSKPIDLSVYPLEVSLSNIFSEVNDHTESEGISHKLYGTDNPLSSITPEAIHQGYIADCYFEASLASVASAHPEIIRDSIKKNQNGSYTVTFPGAKDSPITVNAPTEAELGIFNSGDKYGIWASVMEKAYGELLNIELDAALQISAPMDAYYGLPITPISGPPQNTADGGRNPAPVIFLLTGHDAHNYRLGTDTRYHEELLGYLEKSLHRHPPKVIVADLISLSKKNATLGDRIWYAPHAYSVMGFKPGGKDGGTISLYDPNPEYPQRTEISAADFFKLFDWITAED